ncbi:MAG: DinB family protein [Planctomycetota bacterium]
MSANAQTAIAHGIAGSKWMIERFCHDLTVEEWHHRPCTGANPAAWILGHLILTQRQFLGMVGSDKLPDLPEGFEGKFPRDKTAADAATDFGDVAQLLPIFAEHCDLLAAAVMAASDEALGSDLENAFGPNKTVSDALIFAGLHVASHAGHISTIRRSLGKPPVV